MRFPTSVRAPVVAAVLSGCGLLAACGGAETPAQSPTPTQPLRGINLAGPAYTAVDGTDFGAEAYVSGGTVARIDRVKGVQNQPLFQGCRVGDDLRVDMPLENGTYDVTLYFAEPDRLERDERVFDVFVEDAKRIADLDVMLFRDGKIRSGLTVTVPDVTVADGDLGVHFGAGVNEPLLCALLVRDKMPRDADWGLAWSDEFDAAELDTDTWNIEEWEPRRVNDEDQAYTAREKNLRIEDGILVIEAHREDYGDALYTSSRIQSRGKADFLYGRFEARARLPEGQGTWPAIWMLPSDPFRYATTCSDESEWHGNNECDAWPNSGEIDIMEHVGYQMNHVHGTVHTKAYYWRMWEQRKGRVVLDNVAGEFHVYALEWSPEKIDIFVDDTLYFTYVNEGTGWEAWPFDQAYHWILNVAVGGAWGRAGGPVDDSIFPQRLEVDWVRVYDRAGD